MAVRDDHVFDEVLFLRSGADDSLASAALRGISRCGLALDVSGVADRDNAVVALDKILIQYLVLRIHKLRASLVAELSLDLEKLFADYSLDPVFVREDRAVLLDLLFQIGKACFDLVAFHSGKPSERHGDDRLRLLVGESEAILQVLPRFRNVGGRAYDLDHLFDIVDCDLVSLEDVLFVERLCEIEFHAAGDDLFLELDVFRKDGFERQHLRLAVHEREHIDRAGILKLRIFIKLIQYDVSVRVAAVLDHDPHSGASGFVADVGQSLDHLIAHLLRYGLEKIALYDHVRDLGDDDPVVLLIDLGSRTHHDVSASGLVRLDDPVFSVDKTVRREVGSLYVLHYFGKLGIGVVHEADRAVDDLAEVVRRDVRRHSDCDTDRAVDKQIRKTRREHGRLAAAVIEVADKIDGVAVDVSHHLVGQTRKARLRVSVSCRRVSVNGTEVSVTLDERITEGERLRHSDHRAVYRRVAVRMIASEHVTDRRRGFAERLVVGEVVLVHRVKHTARAGLHSVAYIGKRTAHNDRH